MVHLAIVADDLTGAADTASCFAAAGLATLVPFHTSTLPAADVLAISTESRDLTPEAAGCAVADAVRDVLRQSEREPIRWWYKKIDSVLRGHPREELLAIMETVGISRALVAPAFPSERRTTIGGRQYYAGERLEVSRFGRPGATSDLGAVFGNDRNLPVRSMPLEVVRSGRRMVGEALDTIARGIVVADAETDDDLSILAEAVVSRDRLVLCGAAGFARRLAIALPLAGEAPRPDPRQHWPGPVLVVAGSQHEATLRQIRTVAAAGVPVITLHQTMIDDAAASLEQVVTVVEQALAGNQPAVVTTAGQTLSPLAQREVARVLATLATDPRIASRFGGLVMTGGDTAAAVCAALAATAIRLGGDVLPGIPWGSLEGGVLPGLPVVTKAGSFGGEDALLTAIRFLDDRSRPPATSSPTP